MSSTVLCVCHLSWPLQQFHGILKLFSLQILKHELQLKKWKNRLILKRAAAEESNFPERSSSEVSLVDETLKCDISLLPERAILQVCMNSVYIIYYNLPSVVVHACNPSYLGGWDRRIAWTQEAEVAVSWDCILHSSVGDRARLCLKKEENFKNNNNKNI